MDTTTLHVAPPAGWYHDPMGLPQLRYWNGRAWTNQVTGAQAPSLDAA